MRVNYERWAICRLRENGACRVERGMTCIPLRDDPICLACYESDSYQEVAQSNREHEEE